MAARVAARHLPAGLPPAFFLTDPERTAQPERIVAGLPAGWGVIYRHFGAEDREAVARRLLKLCRKRRLLLLIGADAVLAAKIGAHGVHWPGRLAGGARKWHGRLQIQTMSGHFRDNPGHFRTLPVSAVLYSAVFPSRSASAGAAMGALRFRQIAKSLPCPVYALGGVNPDNGLLVADSAGLAAIDGWRCFEVREQDPS
ncbi:thiamine monophosphate synthase family protein [Hyphomonas neptunium ATCC 15444]|uniref:Thiamine monophosphate synthase family protein n=3 Tax=Hyphomonadaceae TaxID=69657 RepID=Q0BWB9_HYPNA|nr:thiamine monophosphate synthase family protein [Hyphomonas neptunium ATCC 15444]KCZ94799.1 thiamine monophosphate synthase family protein [Hyphomonas hirschiana VP5]